MARLRKGQVTKEHLRFSELVTRELLRTFPPLKIQQNKGNRTSQKAPHFLEIPQRPFPRDSLVM